MTVCVGVCAQACLHMPLHYNAKTVHSHYLPVHKEVVEYKAQDRGNCGGDGDVTFKVVLQR